MGIHRNRMFMAVFENEIQEEAEVPDSDRSKSGNQGGDIDWKAFEGMETRPLLDEVKNNDLIRERVPLISRIVAEVKKSGSKILEARA